MLWGKRKSWWEGMDFTSIESFSAGMVFIRAALSKVEGSHPEIHSFSQDGYLGEEGKEKIWDILEEAGAKAMYHTIGYSGYQEAILAWPDSAVALSISSNGHYNLGVHTTRPEFFVNVLKEIKPLTVPAPKRGTAYAIKVKSNGTGLTTMALGEIKQTFREGNYSTKVLVAFDQAIQDLGAKAPLGRLTLLTGEPGTGKSHFIRGVMTRCDANFLVIPPTMLGELTGPQVISLLDDVRHDKLPTVLVLEDADAALVRRENGRLGAISELLNLADGITGELLDIRILATTNAKEVEMDPAITRPGRLSQIVEFGLLDPHQASLVLKDITEGEVSFSWPSPVSLATVYQKANEAKGLSTVAGQGRTHLTNRSGKKSGHYL